MLNIYKIFHLVTDDTNNVPDKVFIVQSLKTDTYITFQRNLKFRPDAIGQNMIGIIGPDPIVKEKILVLLKKQKSTEDIEQLKQKINDISLQSNQKAAVFLIQIKKNIKSQNKKDERDTSKNIGFLMLSMRPQFYYDKPYNRHSICYIPFRYICDITHKMVVLFDQGIERQFIEQGSIFTQTENSSFSTFRLQMNNLEEIQILKKECGIKISEIQNKNYIFQQQKYGSQAPTQQSQLTFLKKEQALNLQQKKQHLRRQLWQFLTEGNRDKNYIKDQVQNRGAQIFIYQLDKLLLITRVSFKDFCLKQIKNYYYSWFNKITSKIIETQTVTINILADTSYYFILKKFNYSGNQKIYEKTIIQQSQIYQFKRQLNAKYYDIKGKYQLDIDFDNLYNGLMGKIRQISNEFLRLTNRFLKFSKFYSSEINFLHLQLNKIDSKQGSVQRISHHQSQQFAIPSEFLTKKLQKLDHKNIKRIDVYRVISSNIYLIFIQLKQKVQNYFSFILKYENKEWSLIKNHAQKIKFIYDEKCSKGYQLKTNFISNQSITIINFSKGRILSEKNYSFKINKTIISCDVSNNCNKQTVYLLTNQNIYYIENLKPGYNQPYPLINRGQQFPKYRIIKCFRKACYIAAALIDQIHILMIDINKNISVRQSIKIDYQYFKNIKIFSRGVHQFLLVISQNNTQAYQFKNMLLDTRLTKNKVQITRNMGNPILDIFYESYFRFGKFQSNGSFRNLDVCVFTGLEPQRIMRYWEQLNLRDHQLQILGTDSFQRYINNQTNILTYKQLNERIGIQVPIQLCAIENGNLVPMSQGKNMNICSNKQQSTVAIQSKKLFFGIIENIIIENNKNSYVISVMGAQSTGKSYIMNRLFQSKFTVSATRTTVGVWISLLKTREQNYILLDCQGLFSNDRTQRQQQKLIKLIASVSDLTILNQNLAMNNRSITSLLEQIARSPSLNNGDNRQLYRGQLLALIRDVRNTESGSALEQFQRSFQNQNSRRNQFISKLFNNRISFMTLDNFTTESFERGINELRKNITQLVRSNCSRRPLEVLDALKIVMTQLYFDDTNSFAKNQIDLKIEQIKQYINDLWIKGIPDSPAFTYFIDSKQLCFHQHQIVLSYQNDELNIKETLQKVIEQFHKLFPQNEINSQNHNSLYTQLNGFFTKFFENRINLIEKIFLQRWSEQIKGNQQLEKYYSIYLTKIKQQSNNLKLCLKKCQQCDLKCISSASHKRDDWKDILKKKIISLQNSINDNKIDLNNHQQLLDFLFQQEPKREIIQQKIRNINRLSILITENQEIKTQLQRLQQVKAQRESSISNTQRQQVKNIIKFVEQACKECNQLFNGNFNIQQIRVNQLNLQNYQQINDSFERVFNQLIDALNQIREKQSKLKIQKQNEKSQIIHQIQQIQANISQESSKQKEIQIQISKLQQILVQKRQKLQNLNNIITQKQQILGIQQQQQQKITNQIGTMNNISPQTIEKYQIQIIQIAKQIQNYKQKMINTLVLDNILNQISRNNSSKYSEKNELELLSIQQLQQKKVSFENKKRKTQLKKRIANQDESSKLANEIQQINNQIKKMVQTLQQQKKIKQIQLINILKQLLRVQV